MFETALDPTLDPDTVLWHGTTTAGVAHAAKTGFWNRVYWDREFRNSSLGLMHFTTQRQVAMWYARYEASKEPDLDPILLRARLGDLDPALMRVDAPYIRSPYGDPLFDHCGPNLEGFDEEVRRRDEIVAGHTYASCLLSYGVVAHDGPIAFDALDVDLSAISEAPIPVDRLLEEESSGIAAEPIPAPQIDLPWRIDKDGRLARIEEA